MNLRFLILSSSILLSNLTYGQYSVKGRVNLGPDWHPKIYMAAIKKLSDYYRTSPDMIVNTTSVDSNGNFTLSGDNLPKSARFYRIYLMKKQNTDYDACLYVGGNDHNFAHLLLQNGDSVEVISNHKSIAPFGDYTIKGNIENQLMKELAHIVFPSFYFYRLKFPTELKFSEDKLFHDLRNFADTCSNSLVGLAAINSMDFDEYYDKDALFFRQFGDRLRKTVPKSIYTKNYQLKLKYYSNDFKEFPNWTIWLICSLVLCCFILSVIVFQLKKRIEFLKGEEKTSNSRENDTIASQAMILTQKEKEILQLIYEGKSNKEIASKLFIELSTVKTHINKLYSKIGATNRKEAQNMAKNYYGSGV